MQIDRLSCTLCMHTHFVSYKHTLPHSHATQTLLSPADLLLCLYVLHFSLQSRAHTPQMITSVHLVAFSTLPNLCLVSYLPVSDKASNLLDGLSLFFGAEAPRVSVSPVCHCRNHVQGCRPYNHAPMAVYILNLVFMCFHFMSLTLISSQQSLM